MKKENTNNKPAIIYNGKEIRIFNNPALDKSTEIIASALVKFAAQEELKNRAIAKELGKIKTTKSYESAGFKSVSEYAEEVFGMKKGMSYALAAAGEVYNDPKASQGLKDMTPTNLSVIASMDREMIEKDVSSGKIGKATTQAELKEYRKNAVKTKSGGSVEVVKMYNMYVPGRGFFVGIDDTGSHGWTGTIQDFDRRDLHSGTIEYWDGFMKTHYGASLEIINLPKGPAYIDGKPGDKKTVTRKLYISHDFEMAVEFYETTPVNHKLEKKTSKKKDITKMTRDEIVAYLANMDSQSTEEEKGV